MNPSALDEIQALLPDDLQKDPQVEKLQSFFAKLEELRDLGLSVDTSLESGFTVRPCSKERTALQEDFVLFQNRIPPKEDTPE